MCSILVFAKDDNIHPDPKQQWRKFGRGDVIDIHEDDAFFWGNDIQGPKALGWWRVVVMPGVPKEKVLGLLSEEVLDYPALESAPRKLRINKIDLDAIEAEAAGTKGAQLGVRDAAMQTEQAVLSKVQMKPLTEPDGSDRFVKG